VTFEGRGVEWWALPACAIRMSVSIRARFAAFAIKAERTDDFVGGDMLFGGLSEQRRRSQQRSDGERHPDSLQNSRRRQPTALIARVSTDVAQLA
jgi:hypothetical protein